MKEKLRGRMTAIAWWFLIAAILITISIRIGGYKLTEMELLIVYWKQWGLVILLSMSSIWAAVLASR